MTIGINGSAGQLGRAVLTEILKRRPQQKLVAISRTPAGLGQEVEGRLGDYDQPETLVSAYAGLDRLFLIPSPDLRPGILGTQLVAAVQAAVKAGVEHIVLLSSAGARSKGKSEGGPEWGRVEQELIRTAQEWTILRMNYFTETFAQEVKMSLDHGRLVGLGENRVGFVSRDDVAAAAAGVLVGEGHGGATYNLTGPDRVSGAQRAEGAAKVVGRPLQFAVLSEEQLRAGLNSAGLPAFLVDAVVSMQQRFVSGHYDLATGDVEILSGKSPDGFEDVLRRALNGQGA